MWISGEYRFASTFCLKPSNVTHTGGKSLMLPTPYAFKMALLDIAITHDGYEFASDLFPVIRDLVIYWNGPSAICIMQVVEKVSRIDKKGFGSSIVKQEYCTYSDKFSVMVGNLENENIANRILRWMRMLAYLGRNSSLVSCQKFRLMTVPESDPYLCLCQPHDPMNPRLGVVQRMDDMKDNLTLEHVSTYNRSLPKHSMRHYFDIVIPYRLTHTENGMILYERVRS